MVAKDMRDTIYSLDQGKMDMSKEVNRKMCEILYQSIGWWIYICACLFGNREEFDGKVRQFCALPYQSF